MTTAQNTIDTAHTVAHEDIQNIQSVVVEMADILKTACENGGLATATLKMKEENFEAKGYKALMALFDLPENTKMEAYFAHVNECEDCYRKLSAELTSRNKERDYLDSMANQQEANNYYEHELKIKDWNF